MTKRDAGTRNRRILEAVARRIRPLLERIVFVGGQVAELLVTSPGAVRVRPTTDVDVVVSTTTRLAYHDVEEELRELGLRADTSADAPVCRWIVDNEFKLDVMPVAEEILGFSNRWYRMALERAILFALAEDLTIRIPPAPVYIATKWEAFRQRGEADLLGSHDMEDVIAVVAGRPELLEEVADAPQELQAWLGEEARQFLRSDEIEYALEGSLPDAVDIPNLIPTVLERFNTLAGF